MERCRVTHPFHPWYGQELDVVERRCDWNGDRLYFQDPTGSLRSLPTRWTSAHTPDPIEALGGARAHFRIDDLLRLAALIEHLRAGREPGRSHP